LQLLKPDSIKAGLAEITISPTSAAVGKQIVGLGLPKEVVIMMIGRNNHAFIPTGRSILCPHDTLLVFADQERLTETLKIIDAYDPRQIPGPSGEVL
jgi:Trk K+ transport system NAD-binding subunit